MLSATAITTTTETAPSRRAPDRRLIGWDAARDHATHGECVQALGVAADEMWPDDDAPLAWALAVHHEDPDTAPVPRPQTAQQQATAKRVLRRYATARGVLAMGHPDALDYAEGPDAAFRSRRGRRREWGAPRTHTSGHWRDVDQTGLAPVPATDAARTRRLAHDTVYEVYVPSDYSRSGWTMHSRLVLREAAEAEGVVEPLTGRLARLDAGGYAVEVSEPVRVGQRLLAVASTGQCRDATVTRVLTTGRVAVQLSGPWMPQTSP